MHPPSDHFQGKSVVEHLVDARKKGMEASVEIHGFEMAGHKSAFADALRDTAAILLFFWILLEGILSSFGTYLLLLSIGWILWKTARSALIGWNRLERLHRVIEEERWEIEHHRPQEKQELKELYRAKGFEEPLLDQVVEVMMADDNRLLQIMLEEEMGLTLEAYEHPLKQALGAGLGALTAACIGFIGLQIPHIFPWAIAVAFLFGCLYTTRLEKNRSLPSLIWNMAILILCAGTLYFLKTTLIF